MDCVPWSSSRTGQCCLQVLKLIPVSTAGTGLGRFSFFRVQQILFHPVIFCKICKYKVLITRTRKFVNIGNVSFDQTN
jgi:hypothetical protein